MTKDEIIKIGLESYKKGSFDTINLLLNFLETIKLRQSDLSNKYIAELEEK